MALIGIDPSEVLEYISKKDPDPKNPTVFKLGVVDSLTIAKIEDNLTVFTIDPNNPEAKTDTKMSTGKREIELIRAGLKGWDNYKDKKGADIPFTTTYSRAGGSTKIEIPNDDTIKRLSTIIVKELSGEIYNQNKVSDDERKNSD